MENGNQIQVVLRLHGSLTTQFSIYITRFILLLSFAHLVLNHSSAYMAFCLHDFQSLKKHVGTEHPVFEKIKLKKINKYLNR